MSVSFSSPEGVIVDPAAVFQLGAIALRMWGMESPKGILVLSTVLAYLLPAAQAFIFLIDCLVGCILRKISQQRIHGIFYYSRTVTPCK